MGCFGWAHSFHSRLDNRGHRTRFSSPSASVLCNSLMAANEPRASAINKGKKRKQYLPYNVTYSLIHTLYFNIMYVSVSVILILPVCFLLQKPVKKRGAYPLRPGVQGFFITCDGGRERQAAHEAMNVIDTVCFLLLSSNFNKFFSLLLF